MQLFKKFKFTILLWRLFVATYKLWRYKSEMSLQELQE